MYFSYGGEKLIYRNVKELAENRNMTIRQVELQAELGNGTVARWKKSMPSITTLKKVADLFGVTVEELIKEKEVEA